jgi:hypothetical protein
MLSNTWFNLKKKTAESMTRNTGIEKRKTERDSVTETDRRKREIEVCERERESMVRPGQSPQNRGGNVTG